MLNKSQLYSPSECLCPCLPCSASSFSFAPSLHPPFLWPGLLSPPSYLLSFEACLSAIGMLAEMHIYSDLTSAEMPTSYPSIPLSTLIHLLIIILSTWSSHT